MREIKSKGIRIDKNGNLQLDKRHKSFYYKEQGEDMKYEWKRFKDELPKDDSFFWKYDIDDDYIEQEKAHYWRIEWLKQNRPNDLWCYAEVPEKPQIRWNNSCCCKEEVELTNEELSYLNEPTGFYHLMILKKVLKKLGMIE